MEVFDEVDYGDSDSDFADLEVEDEEETPAAVKEAGEATPEEGAFSELEEGEFLADPQSMQLEVEEAAPGRHQESRAESSSDEERRKRRRRLSPDRRESLSHNGRQSSRERQQVQYDQEGKAPLGWRGPAYGLTSNQGLKNGFQEHRPFFEAGALSGSLATPPVRAIEMDLATFLRQPSPFAATRPGPVLHPGQAPPMQLRGASNLFAHEGRAGNGHAQAPQFGHQLRPDHRQHLHQAGRPPSMPLITRELVLDASGSIRFVDRPPKINLTPFTGPDFRPDSSRQLLVGISSNQEFHTSLLHQGSRFLTAPPLRNLPPVQARSSPHVQGLISIPGAPPLRPFSESWGHSNGKLESLRNQLEAQGNVQGGPMPRQQRGSLPLPVKPSARHTSSEAPKLATISRADSVAGALPSVKSLDAKTPPLKSSTSTEEKQEGVSQVQRSSPGRKSPVKMPKLEDSTSIRKRDAESGEDRALKAETNSASEKDGVVRLEKKGPSLELNSKEKVTVDEAMPEKPPREQQSSILSDSEALPKTEKRTRSEAEGTVREESSSKAQRAEEAQPNAAASPSVRGEGSALGLQACDSRKTTLLKEDEGAKERDIREKGMRARALEILEAGKARKRKERDEEERSSLEEGTSGRGSVHGSKRFGRDAQGQRVPRNWRKHASSDGEEREGSRSQEKLEGERVVRNIDPVKHKQNGRGKGVTGTTANALPLGEKVWSRVGNKRERPKDEEPKAESLGRRVVVGLSQTSDLERFAVRERGASHGPPGFDRSARVGRSESEQGLADRRANGERAVIGNRAQKSSRTLAVDNLPGYFKTGHIADIFKRYGPIHLIRQLGGSSAEITFRNEEHANAARANTHRLIKLEGKELIVDYKAPMPV